MADRNEGKTEPGREPTNFGLLDGLQVVFLVAGCSGFFFSLRGPPANEAHALFRIGLGVVGLIGLVAVTAIKFARRRRP